MTPLDKTLKRVLNINGRDYVITLTPDALKITEKGHRLGIELQWVDIISGESALAVALHASLGKFQDSPKAEAREREELPRPIRKAQSSLKSRRVASKRVPRKRSP